MQQPMILFFFFTDPATTEVYTLSLHDALPISGSGKHRGHDSSSQGLGSGRRVPAEDSGQQHGRRPRSEEHTSELQSPYDLVCRLLLEKKKKGWPGNTAARPPVPWTLRTLAPSA